MLPARGNAGLRPLDSCTSRPQAGAITGGAAAFTEGPVDFYKSQIQVQIIRSKSIPDYKRTPPC